jgi:hypothetical protein
MNTKQALTLAYDALDVECQRLTVSAHIYKWYHSDSGRRALERRYILLEAKVVLLQVTQQPGLLMHEKVRFGGDCAKV